MSVSESDFYSTENEDEDGGSSIGKERIIKSEQLTNRSWIYKLNKKQLQEKLKQLKIYFTEGQTVDELRRILSDYCKQKTSTKKNTKMTNYSLNLFDGDNWKCFEQQLECIILLNEVEEDKKVPLLLTKITPKVLNVLNCLCSPKNPTSLTYEALCTKLRDKYTQKQPTALERVTFRNRNQLPTETIEQYVLELRKLGGNCDFKDLDDQIKEKFIDGVNSKLIKFELLKSESNKTLEETITLAKTVEFALLQTNDGKQGNEVSEVFFNGQGRKGKTSQNYQKFRSDIRKEPRCFCCGATNHVRSQCTLNKKYCSECGQQGHIFKMCSRNKKINKAYTVEKEQPKSSESEEKASDEELIDHMFDDMTIYSVNKPSNM
ncbi:uncharacterized protein LOC126380176 isoform X3 [Pectinophora gossypiella]|uniref:uncharacterized protein LOC126380176 isoform X3 n=1 Tax=Pectinophora gossypiella TaxID=13191 RepID=UPI00214F24DA|nr:uncharacterized protein LOC126380176 isoform X3 [Pectinophora gossypiella]